MSLGTSAVTNAVRRTSTKPTAKTSLLRTDCSGANRNSRLTTSNIVSNNVSHTAPHGSSSSSSNRKSMLTDIVSGKNLQEMLQGKLKAEEVLQLSVAVSTEQYSIKGTI